MPEVTGSSPVSSTIEILCLTAGLVATTQTFRVGAEGLLDEQPRARADRGRPEADRGRRRCPRHLEWSESR